MVEKSQVVKSNSEAYGYNYASLADIVKQGFKIPPMETRIIEGQIFMGWLDDEKTWHQGAPLVVPEMKGNNEAQIMGAAISYCRRYTAQMALGLACDDDSKLEKKKPQSQTRSNHVDFAQVKNTLKALQSVQELTEYWKGLHLSEKQSAVLKKDFAERRKALESGHDGVER